MIPIQLATGILVTTEELRADVEAAKKIFMPDTWCFAYVTVEALLEKVEEQQALINTLQKPKAKK